MILYKHSHQLTEHTVSGDRFSATHQYAEIQRHYTMYKQQIDKYGIDVILEIESFPVPNTDEIRYRVIAKYEDQTQLAMIKLLSYETV